MTITGSLLFAVRERNGNLIGYYERFEELAEPVNSRAQRSPNHWESP